MTQFLLVGDLIPIISSAYQLDGLLLDETSGDLTLSLTKGQDAHSVTITAQNLDPVTTLRIFSNSVNYTDYSLRVSFDAVSGTYSAETDAPTQLIGTVGDNALIGGSGDDVILGNAGNDILDGGAGDDRLEGGVGNDTYRTSDGADVILTGGGTDTLEVVDGYTLSGALLNASDGSLTITVLDATPIPTLLLSKITMLSLWRRYVQAVLITVSP